MIKLIFENEKISEFLLPSIALIVDKIMGKRTDESAA